MSKLTIFSFIMGGVSIGISIGLMFVGFMHDRYKQNFNRLYEISNQAVAGWEKCEAEHKAKPQEAQLL